MTLRPFLPLVLAAWAAGAALPAPAAGVAFAPDAPVVRLDEIGLYAVGYRLRGAPERRMPDGWTGHFTEDTGISCQPAGRQDGRDAFLIHSPWRAGVGVTFQEFTVRLPQARRIRLTGATAMRTDVVGRSDGATFRVLVDGAPLLDEHRANAGWRPHDLDLSRHAGRTVRIRYEVGPGPRGDSSFDFSLWGDRALRLEGWRPAPIPALSPPALNLARLRPRVGGGVAPISGYPSRASVRVAAGRAVLRSEGPDGAFAYHWTPPRATEESLLGRVELRATFAGRTVTVPLASAARVEWTGRAESRSSRLRAVPGGVQLRRGYRVDGRAATVTVTARLVGKSLIMDVTCDAPFARAIDIGRWGPVMRRRPMVTPFYSGQVAFLPREHLFVNAFLDWTTSRASSHDGSRAIYGTILGGRRNLLRERAVWSAARHLAEVLPNIPNPPSPYLRDMAPRIVLDTWGGRYADIAASLRELHDHGVRHAYVIVHVWQRDGYDNALPAHWPANAELGGSPAMRELVSTARRLGYRIALHENYVDYYPNFEGFDERHIVLDQAGNRMLAWYNPGTRIQSFAIQPNAIMPLARTQSPEINRRYRTNASFLDVHSAVPPWFRVDFREGEKGAGTFARFWEVNHELWRFLRRVHGGPVTGEGNAHWFWSGLLDGVEAQFGSGWPIGQGMEAPLAVDFNLLRVHPLQLNHGMGYYERWWSNPTWGAVPPMRVLDQYRMQQVAYGHAGFLGARTWSIVPLAWLEHHLLTPVTARYAGVPVSDIRYMVNGRWVDGSRAAAANVHRRVDVRFANGLRIVANDDERPLNALGVVLPRFGWVAEGAGVRAWTAMRNGVVADYSETRDRVFANARNARDWNITGLRRLRPRVASFRQTGPRRFDVAYAWEVRERVDADVTCFVHFSDIKPAWDPHDEGIRFQGDHTLPRPVPQWRPGETVTYGPLTVTVPDDVPDGDYAWSIGLFPRGGGARLAIEGHDDGHGRIVLGTLRVRDGGRTLSFEPERRTGAERTALYTERLNTDGRAVDFGPVVTDGSVLVEREGNEWVMRLLPRDRPFRVELAAARFGSPRALRSVGGAQASVATRRQGNRWTFTPNGARQYRWAVAASAPPTRRR